MRPFQYTRAADQPTAISAGSASGAKFLAGGTNLVDLMKEDVERPSTLVDINRLALKDIRATAAGVSIGALAHNTETANHPFIRQNFPLLTQAILSGATAQLRNMATNGGNLNQRTRCPYFYEVGMPCNKREPGSGCGAIGGINRMHAIFGASDKCIAVHPSDMCVALAALDAVIKVAGPSGERTIAFPNYHRLPGDTPEMDNNLAPGELVTSIEIPRNKLGANSYYLKVRDRSSYAFALVSVAAGLDLKGKQIQTPRIAMGGVAHMPWRAFEAEKFLIGKDATEANFRAAADAEMANAKPREYNKFKVELGRRAIVRALTRAANGGAA
jgi:xanthine dehydrogenase YagS FAD-binding subunit